MHNTCDILEGRLNYIKNLKRNQLNFDIMIKILK